MISFKAFINTVHYAIMGANDLIMDKNIGLLYKYFDETTVESKDEKGNLLKDSNDQTITKKVMVPKSVILEYPSLTEEGESIVNEVHVPLITLVPLTTSKIEKATFSADFELQIIDNELQIDFVNSSKKGSLFKKSKTSIGKLEITVTPQESSDGLKLLIEEYEALLKKQIS